MLKLSSVLLVGSMAWAAAPQNSVEDHSATFRAGTKLVEVVVVARDKHGPATGLTRADFTLLDNGVPQNVAFFSVRSGVALATAPPATRPLSSALPPGVISNRPTSKEDAAATQTVLLLDRIFTSQTSQIFAIDRISKFLDLRRMQDGIGIYSLGRDVRVIQDVTDDDGLLQRAAKSLKAHDVSYRSSDTTGMTTWEAESYSQLNLQERILALKHALQATARHLANVPGRKNLIWISEAFPCVLLPAPSSLL